MIKLYYGSGNLDTLDTYLERKLDSLQGKGDGIVRRKLDTLVKRILANESCLKSPENSTQNYVRFLTCYFKIQKLSVDLEGHQPQELRSALRLARSHFTGQSHPFSTIHLLKRVNRFFYFQTLAMWIEKQKVSFETLPLSTQDVWRLAPHLTYLKISSSHPEGGIHEEQVGELLWRTKQLRHLTIKDCRIRGLVFTKFKNTQRLESLVIKRCVYLDHALPEGVVALQKLKVEHCPDLGDQLRLEFLAPIYIANKERALKFAGSLGLSHLAILSYFFEDPVPYEDVQFLIQRLSFSEARNMVYSMLGFGRAFNFKNYPAQMVEALLKTPEGKKFIKYNVFDFLKNPELLQFLYQLYPPGIPENQSLYPIESDLQNGILHLTMIPTMPLDYPDVVFDLLTTTQFEEIRIDHYGSEARDGEEPLKRFFSDLMQGLFYSSQKLQFVQTYDDNYVLSPKKQYWTSCFAPLGKVMGLALRSGCTIGEVFPLAYIRCICSFREEDLISNFTAKEFLKRKSHSELIEFMNTTVHQTPEFYLVERVLLSQREEECIKAAQSLNTRRHSHRLREAIDAGDMNQIRSCVRSIWFTDYYDYITSAQIIARVMKQYLPIQISTLSGGTQEILRWDDLFHVNVEDFAMKLQGKLAMAKAILRNPASRGYVYHYIFSFLEDMQLQPLLLAAYPPSVPENRSLYPIKEHIHDKVLYLTIIPTMPLDYPDEVFERLEGCEIFTRISVRHYGSPGVDLGGLRKQFFADLTYGLTHTSKQFNFEKTKNGMLVPAAKASLSTKEKGLYRRLGSLLSLALRWECPIGRLFSMEFIHCIRLFTTADLDNPAFSAAEFLKGKSDLELAGYMADSAPRSTVFPWVYTVLVAEHDKHILAAVKTLNKHWFDDELAEAIDGGDRNEIKEVVRSNWLGDYYGYIEAAHAMACGMKTALPFVLKYPHNDIEIKDWDSLGFIATEDLVFFLQGEATVKWITNNLVFAPEDQPATNNVKKWVKQWFKEHQEEEELLANVIQTFTGARGLVGKVTFNLSPDVKGLYIHTCFQQIDVPSEIDEEGIRQVLDSCGRGENLQFNRS